MWIPKYHNKLRKTRHKNTFSLEAGRFLSIRRMKLLWNNFPEEQTVDFSLGSHVTVQGTVACGGVGDPHTCQGPRVQRGLQAVRSCTNPLEAG